MLGKVMVQALVAQIQSASFFETSLLVRWISFLFGIHQPANVY
jgi:hypothetical protein